MAPVAESAAAPVAPSNMLDPTTAAVKALQAAANDLQVRSEAESVRMAHTSDVETAAALSAAIRVEAEADALRGRLSMAERALAETRAVARAEASRRAELGDAFVTEMAKLGSELAQLESWKDSNEDKVVGYQDLERQLTEARDRVAALEMAVGMEEEKREHIASMEQKAEAEAKGEEEMDGENDGNVDLGSANEDGAVEVIEGTAELNGGDVAELEDGEEEVDPTSIDGASEDAAAPPDTIDDDKQQEAKESQGKTKVTENVTVEDEPKDLQRDAAQPDAEAETEAPAPAPTPAALLPPLDDEPATLDTVADSVLMNIFAHLEAPDILSSAQLSVIMYSRVDILFGLGGNVGGSSAETDPAPAPAPAPTPEVSAPIPEEESTSAEPSTNAAATAAKEAMDGLAGVFSQVRGRGFGLRGPLSSPPSTPQHGASRAPSPPPGSSIALPTSSTTPAPGDGEGTAAQKPMLFTSELANAMAEKLTPAELSVIINMRNSLRASEAEMAKMRSERDDFMAELKGADSVKDFLVAKLRDIEGAHRLAESEREKLLQNAKSDQEVIAFLDYRIQELESSSEAADQGRDRARKELEGAKVKNKDQVRVLSDMLRFERDQMSSAEKEWKATKKVLIKEVKQCRAQIISLEAERDGLREQNGKLRDALLH